MTEENPRPPLRPLREVWLRPRYVFRTMAATPIGAADYLLACAQGIVSWLALCRAQSAGLHADVAGILGKALLVGPFAGVLGVLLMTAVYSRIGRGAGGTANRNQVFHVLAYGGVPLVASLAIWVLTAAALGPVVFVHDPPAGLDPMVRLVLFFQSGVHLALVGWSLLLQVMGFSEVEGFATRRAFGVWISGQLLILVAVVLLAALAYGPDVVPSR